MDSIDTDRIKSFASAQKAEAVPTSEQIFVLSSSQLQRIVKQAILEAAEPFLEEIRDLKATLTRQDEKIAALEATQDTQAENELNMLRLINDLRKKDSGKTEISRAEKIEKYLEARPDHKATFETLKGHLGIDNDRLGKVIRALVSSGKCAVIRTPGDKRKRSIILLSK